MPRYKLPETVLLPLDKEVEANHLLLALDSSSRQTLCYWRKRAGSPKFPKARRVGKQSYTDTAEVAKYLERAGVKVKRL